MQMIKQAQAIKNGKLTMLCLHTLHHHHEQATQHSRQSIFNFVKKIFYTHPQTPSLFFLLSTSSFSLTTSLFKFFHHKEKTARSM